MSLALRNYSKNNRRKMGTPKKGNSKHRLGALVSEKIPYISMLFPDILRCKMRNVINTQFTAAAGVVTAWGISANSLHTPQSTVVSGAAALVFNQQTTIVGLGQLLGAGGVATNYAYSGYRIYGCSIELKVQSTVNTSPGVLICFPTSQGINLGNVNAYNIATQSEYPYSKNAHVGLITENQGVIIKNDMTTAKMFGVRHETTIESIQYSAQGGSAPQALWQWIVAWDPDTSNNSPIDLYTTLVYDVEFYQRSQMATATI